MRAVLAYRFQRKTQAELALKSAVFGDFRPHTPDKEHSPLTLIKFDSCLLIRLKHALADERRGHFVAVHNEIAIASATIDRQT